MVGTSALEATPESPGAELRSVPLPWSARNLIGGISGGNSQKNISVVQNDIGGVGGANSLQSTAPIQGTSNAFQGSISVESTKIHSSSSQNAMLNGSVPLELSSSRASSSPTNITNCGSAVEHSIDHTFVDHPEVIVGPVHTLTNPESPEESKSGERSFGIVGQVHTPSNPQSPERCKIGERPPGMVSIDGLRNHVAFLQGVLVGSKVPEPSNGMSAAANAQAEAQTEFTRTSCRAEYPVAGLLAEKSKKDGEKGEELETMEQKLERLLRESEERANERLLLECRRREAVEEKLCRVRVELGRLRTEAEKSAPSVPLNLPLTTECRSNPALMEDSGTLEALSVAIQNLCLDNERLRHRESSLTAQLEAMAEKLEMAQQRATANGAEMLAGRTKELQASLNQKELDLSRLATQHVQLQDEHRFLQMQARVLRECVGGGGPLLDCDLDSERKIQTARACFDFARKPQSQQPNMPPLEPELGKMPGNQQHDEPSLEPASAAPAHSAGRRFIRLPGQSKGHDGSASHTASAIVSMASVVPEPRGSNSQACAVAVPLVSTACNLHVADSHENSPIIDSFFATTDSKGAGIQTAKEKVRSVPTHNESSSSQAKGPLSSWCHNREESSLRKSSSDGLGLANSTAVPHQSVSSPSLPVHEGSLNHDRKQDSSSPGEWHSPIPALRWSPRPEMDLDVYPKSPGSGAYPLSDRGSSPGRVHMPGGDSYEKTCRDLAHEVRSLSTMLAAGR